MCYYEIVVVDSVALLPCTFPLAAFCTNYIYGRADESHAAGDAHIDAHVVIERCPVDVRGVELLDEQQGQRTEIADEIYRDDEEPHVPPHLEAGYEPLEKYRLETQVGYVYAKRLQEQPPRRRHLDCGSGHIGHRAHAEGGEKEYHAQHPEMVAVHRQQCEYCQQDDRRCRVDVGECPRRDGADIDDADDEVLLDVTLDRQQQIGGKKHDQQRHEPHEQFPPLLPVEGDTLGAGGDVGRRRLGKPGHHPPEETQQWEGECPDQRRHPKLAHVQVVECIQPQRLGHTRAECHAHTHHARKDVGGAPALKETENHAPHTPERQTVEEQGKDVVGHWQHPEHQQRDLGQGGRPYDELQPVARLQFGDELYAYQLGTHVADELDDAHDYLVVHPRYLQPLKLGCGERLAQCVDKRVGEQRRASRP